MGAAGLASLSHALDYFDAIAGQIGSLGENELIEVVARLSQGYREFPELEILRPRDDLLARLQSAAITAPEGTVGPWLVRLAELEAGPGLSLLAETIGKSGDLPVILQYLDWRSSWRSADARWLDFLDILQKQGKANLVLEILSEYTHRGDVRDAVELGNIPARLLSEPVAGDIDHRALAETVQSARRRLGGALPKCDGGATTDAALALAERLRPAVCPRMPARSSEPGWQSGDLAFDEFVLQWPCEVELPDTAADEVFVDDAYQAILLRAPDAGEREQWLRLLERRAVSRVWLIEDLLASEELRLLQRRVQVYLARAYRRRALEERKWKCRSLHGRRFDARAGPRSGIARAAMRLW